MAKCLLWPSLQVAIMAPSGAQSKLLFQKIEDLAKHKVDSIKNKSNVFYNEVRKGPNSDGFHHDDTYYLELFNGSTIVTFNQDPKRNVGKRAHIIVKIIAMAYSNVRTN